jgi:small subunit ribosomal protein S2
MKQLLEAGVHFGHQTRRWNPKMKPFIFTERNGIHILDLQQTVARFQVAYNYARSLAEEGKTILFVGTKKQAQEAVAQEAARCGMYFVNQRWLGGMLTNFTTIQQRLRYLADLEARQQRGEFASLTKREALGLEEQIAKLNRILGGIKGMRRLPDAVYIIDTRKESLAVNEARRLDIPLVALVDTNSDPDEVQYPIPSNDDAIRAVRLLTSKLADAVIEGRLARQSAFAEEPSTAEEWAEDLPQEQTFLPDEVGEPAVVAPVRAGEPALPSPAGAAE